MDGKRLAAQARPIATGHDEDPGTCTGALNFLSAEPTCDDPHEVDRKADTLTSL